MMPVNRLEGGLMDNSMEPYLTPPEIAKRFADDLGALLLAVSMVAAHIKPEHRKQAEEKLRDWFGDEPYPDDDDED